MSGEAIASIIYLELTNDPCLMPLLEDPDGLTIHGQEEFCDQPETRHDGRPVRRYQQGWPGHFRGAIVGFGTFAASQYSPEKKPWLEDWTFRAGVWVQKQMTIGGVTMRGDRWALRIHDAIKRVLGWKQTTPAAYCTEVRILKRQLDGPVEPLRFDEEAARWLMVSQFRWTVISRGLRAPQPVCACA